MSNFQDNLKKYRGKTKFNAKEFANFLGIPYTTYMNYENKGHEPKYKILCEIANALHVSTDELLGSDLQNAMNTKILGYLDMCVQAKIIGLEPIRDEKKNIIAIRDTNNELKDLAFKAWGNPVEVYLENPLPIDKFMKCMERAAEQYKEKTAPILRDNISMSLMRIAPAKFISNADTIRTVQNDTVSENDQQKSTTHKD